MKWRTRDNWRIIGIALFTLVYLGSLFSFKRFISKTPEASSGVYLLATLSTIVYVAGIAALIWLGRAPKTNPGGS